MLALVEAPAPSLTPGLEGAGDARAEMLAPDAITSRQRDSVVRRLTDLFFSAQMSRHERALVDEILARLIVNQDAEARLKLAKRFKDLSELPPRVARILATDEMPIASLVLSRDDSLEDGDLVQVIKATGVEHHLLLAARQKLSAAVSEALVATGPSIVVCAVLRNATAALSRRSFRYLCELAIEESEIRMLLLARDDLPAECAHELFWSVTGGARVTILQRFAVDRRAMIDALGDLAASGPSAHDVDWALRMTGASRRTSRVDGALMPLLTRWLETQGEEASGRALAEKFVLNERTLQRVAQDKGGEPLVVFLKSIGLSSGQFKTLGPALVNCLGSPEPNRLSALSALFDMLSTDWADLALRLWDQQRPASLDELFAGGSGPGA